MTYYADNLKKSIVTTHRKITQMIYDEIEARNAAYREAILRMAQEAGLVSGDPGTGVVIVTRLMRFAALVAAAAEQPKPEPPKPHGYAYRYRDGIRFNGGNTVNGGLPVEVLPYWFAPPDTEVLRRENERLRAELAEAAAVWERCREDIAELKHERRRDMAEICSLRESEESLREEVERLQADAESWRKTLGAAIALGGKNMEEIERLREALVRFGRHQKECDAYRGCVCGLDAALHGETAIWSACHDPRE